MKISSYILKNSSLALLGGVFSVFLFAVAGFIFGLPVQKFYVFFGALVSVAGVFVLNRKCGVSYKISVLQSVVLMALVLLFCKCAVSVYDTTWDGRDYHQSAMIFLKDGWNPFYVSVYDFVKNTYPFAVFRESLLWIQSYVKFEEIFAASVFALTGKIETGKVLNYLSVFILLLYSLYIIEKPVFSSLNHGFKVLTVLVLILNPVVLVQLSAYYNDILIYCYLMMLILTIFNIECNDKISSSDIFVIFSSVVILSNIKMGGLLYSVFLIGVYLIYLAVKKHGSRLKKLALLSVLMIVTVVVTGVNPYITNIRAGHSPFYPIGDADKGIFYQKNIPHQFVKKPMLYKLFYSTFSKPENLDTSLNRTCTLKMPFSMNFISEMPQFEEPDVRVCGFGPYWSAILLMTLLVFLLQLKDNDLRDRPLAKFMLVFVSLSVLVNPENWWARYVPQFWAVPVIFSVCASVFNSGRLKNHLAKFVLYLMLFNSLLIFYINERYVLKFAEKINNFLILPDKTLAVHFFNDELFEVSFLQKLDEKGFVYKIVDKETFNNNRDSFMTLRYPYCLKQEVYMCKNDGEKCSKI